VRLLAAELRDEARLRVEVQSVALLSHPNLSAVYDYGVAGDEPFVVTELVDGSSLAARLARGPLPWRGAVEVCTYVAAALSAMHARGLVHGDVKPANIMLTEAGVKVIDFEVAAVIGSVAPGRLASEMGGPDTDVYALGVVLYTALTGQPPRPVGKIAGLLRGDPGPTPLPVIPGMPLEVAALYQDCLAADPSMRPSSAALAHHLAALAGVRVGAVDVRQNAATSQLPPPTDPQSMIDTRELLLAPPRRGARARRASVKVATAGAAIAAVIVAATAFGLARSGGSSAARWSGGSGASAGSSTSASGAGSAGASASTSPAGSCSVAYQIKETWANGATVSLTIVNTGETDINRWTLEFDLKGGLQARPGWNGIWQQRGTRVTVAAASGNPGLVAGRSVSGVGTNIDGPDANSMPNSFMLNGVRCRTAPQP
jgi:eukaryotic-like serine/threonine-protein kinase